jgi:hypothetical protein
MNCGVKDSCAGALSAYTPAWLAATIRPNRSRIAARGRNEPIAALDLSIMKIP